MKIQREIRTGARIQMIEVTIRINAAPLKPKNLSISAPDGPSLLVTGSVFITAKIRVTSIGLSNDNTTSNNDSPLIVIRMNSSRPSSKRILRRNHMKRVRPTATALLREKEETSIPNPKLITDKLTNRRIVVAY